MRRVLAVLGAVLMIVVALLVRSLVDGDDGGGDGGPATGDDGEPVALLCAEELAEVCAALEDEGVEVEVEAVGDTVDRLSGPEGELAVDGWLTLEPFAAQVDELRGLAGLADLFGEGHPTDWSTGLAIVASDDRAAALEGSCPDGVRWECLGTIAGEPWSDHGGEANWGPVRPGYDVPDRSGTGLLVLAQAMADHLGDTGFARQDIDGAGRWLSGLEDAVPNRRAGDVLSRLVLEGPAAFGAVGTLGNRAEMATATAQGGDLTIFYPAPMFRATVVLAPGQGSDLNDLATSDILAEALDADGWEEGEDGEPLPSAGAIAALRSAWEGT